MESLVFIRQADPQKYTIIDTAVYQYPIKLGSNELIISDAESGAVQAIFGKLKNKPALGEWEAAFEEALPDFVYPFQMDLTGLRILGDHIRETNHAGRLMWEGKRMFTFARLCAKPLPDRTSQIKQMQIWVQMGIKTAKGDWYPEHWPLSKFIERCVDLPQLDKVA